MRCIRATTVGTLVVGAGLFGAAPGHADSTGDAFLAALTNAGITGLDPARAVEVGQSVCPMLSEPGQHAADAAAKVAEATGRPLGPATMFTGLAISIFCPALVARLGEGVPVVPLTMPGR